jgi:hypothetical protein
MPARRLMPGLLLLGLLLMGCGKPKPVKVSGVVVGPDGKGVPNVWVRFQPVAGAGGRFAHGTTDEDGSFSLTTQAEDDGALPGEYKVTIYPLPESREEELQVDPKVGLTRFVDPERREVIKRTTRESPFHANYSSPETTPLTVMVPVRGELRIQLKPDGT